MARRTLAFAAVISLPACDSDSGGSGGYHAAPCPDGETSCFAPFGCTQEPDAGAYYCSSASAGIPACRGEPDGIELQLMSRNDYGIPTHQLLDRCVEVTYDSSVASRASLIEDALVKWADVECNRFCLTGPTLDEDEPDPSSGERRIHFTVGDTGSPTTIAQPPIYHEISTGRARCCVVVLRGADLASIAVGEVLGSFINCAGFGYGTSDSVLGPAAAGSRPEDLTAPDVTALCAVYGTPGFCADEEERF